MTLRPYQTQCIETIIQKMREGKQRQGITLPTGAGKSLIFGALIGRLKHGRALVIAHRDELIQQAVDKILMVNPDIDIAIEKGKHRADFEHKVVVASVQTLKGKRLERWPKDHFALVVIDEAHRSSAKTYREVIEYFGLGTNPVKGRLLLGVTATFFRGAGKQNLGEIYEEITYQATIRDLVRDGYLCNIKGFSVGTDVSLDGIKTVLGDFDQAELEKRVNVESRNQVIVDGCNRLAPGEQTVVFTVSVAHAQNLARMFNESGVKTEAVWGDMHPDARKAALTGFAKGEIQVLTNKELLTEGWDCPSVSAIVMACPTKSQVKYMQCVGRGTRLYPGKDHLKVLDLEDLITKYNLCHLGTLVGRKDKPIPSALDLLEWADSEDKREAGEREAKVAALRMQTSVMDLLSDANTFREWSEYAWIELTPNKYYLKVGDTSYWIELCLDGEWETHDTFLENYGRYKDLQQAIHSLNDPIMLRAQVSDCGYLVSASARWRRSPASDSQLAKLDKYHIEYPPDVTKGQAGTLITRYFDKRGWLK